MKFDTFIKNIHLFDSLDLPSKEAHIKMIPKERDKMFLDSVLDDRCLNNARKASVMMLFYPKEGMTYLVLILRNSYIGVHSSQISFPGGKVEEDDFDLQYTAIRETFEEIGVNKNKMKIIRPFTEAYIPPSNFLVSPFLGVCNEELSFKLQESEVSDIIELPISLLLDDSIVTSRIMNTSYANNIEVPCFKVNDNYIWGATAMMLSELKDFLKMIF